MTVLLQKSWKEIAPGLHITGCPQGTPDNLVDIPALKSWLVSQRVHFGVIQETSDHIFACVDRTRSFPLFYAVVADEFYLSAHPAQIVPHLTDQITNPEAIAVYLESGYCVDDQTFYHDIHQLVSGEYLIWNKQQKKLTIESYYHYTPRFPDKQDNRDYRSELGQILDKTIERVITQAAGREIWVPLSGGLDSRAVLGKLVEQGYKNIQTFSYGSKGNTDCETARDIARMLDVPWRYIEPDYKAQKEFFDSDAATIFLNQASRYSSGPTFTDFFALKTLYDAGDIGTHTLLVNGQSGDYLTGGHLPVFAENDNPEQQVMNFFMTKHFNLWNSLKDIKEGICIDFVEQQRKIFNQMFSMADKYRALYSFFNWLEWRERQSKYVIACQVNYDYFNCDWAIPLWDSDLMDFYEDLPFDIFTGQKLYIDYLESWNYKNLFSFIRRPVDPWPRNRPIALTIGRAAGLIAGKNAKDDVYKFMRYWSTQDVHYKLMPLRAWREIWRDIRNAEGFYALEGLTRANLKIKWPPEFENCRHLIDRHRDIMK